MKQAGKRRIPEKQMPLSVLLDESTFDRIDSQISRERAATGVRLSRSDIVRQALTVYLHTVEAR